MDPDPLPALVLSIFNPISISGIIGLSIISFLLICSAFLSGAEVAYFSIGPKDSDSLKTKNDAVSNSILSLLENPQKLLATILIANNFVNVGIVILFSFLSEILFSFSDSIFFGVAISANIQEFLILVVTVTFLILMFGEVVPKVYANKNPIKMASVMVYPILTLQKILWWIGLSPLLMNTTSLVDGLVRKKSKNISVDELSHALELTSNEDVSKEDQKILKGIVKFGNTDVKQIMKPRVDVVAINIETSYGDVLKEIIEVGFSRIPVYRESFDKVEGILYVKDLLAHLDKDDSFAWQTLIREPYFVPATKKIDDLLKEFQERRIHLATVVDEYGGNSGIITLEDIIEEIVGDITDEFDDDDLIFSKLDDCNYLFEGKTPLKDLYRVLNIEGNNFEEKKGDSDTVAGFLLELSGKILQKNEKVIFENYTFTIEASDRRRIKRVKVTIHEPEVEAQ